MLKLRVVLVIALSYVTSFALLSAYHVEPRTAGQSGQTWPRNPGYDYVSQIVTVNFDELDGDAGGCYVELFSGGACTRQGYGLAVTTYPGGTTVAYQTVTEGVEHGWVKFKLSIAYPESIVRGKKLKFTFRRGGSDNSAA
jgi:hypothetical protein